MVGNITIFAIRSAVSEKQLILILNGKLALIGIPTYGRGFTLRDNSVHGVGAASKDASHGMPYTRSDGFLAYYEVSQQLFNNLALTARGLYSPGIS